MVDRCREIEKIIDASKRSAVLRIRNWSSFSQVGTQSAFAKASVNGFLFRIRGAATKFSFCLQHLYRIFVYNI